MRAVVYARFSSDLQRDASIDDQLEVCRRLLDREGWQLTKVYADRAISGASRNRPEYQQLLADADRSHFDVVVFEALDRLGRKLADIADFHDRLAFRGIKLFAVNTGEITQLHVGLLGTMSQLYLSDLRDKVRRGLLGRVLQGRLAGGLAYGYDVIEDDDPRGGRGLRRINESEAATVRRIFEAFAAGTAPRALAKILNAEGVPGPGGRPWGDTTIRGQVDRGTGLLNNPHYVGRLEWNRTSYVKDPRTGRRTARVNAPDKRETVEVPELRIIDDDLWARVKARQAEVRIEMGKDGDGNALNRAHRRQFLLSGLLVCGECGGSYTIVGKDRYGCATRRSKGTCSNAATITRQAIEERVLGGLKDRLLAPELVKEFVAEYQAEMNRAARDANHKAAALRQDLGAIERKIAGIVRAIEDGAYNPTLTRRLTELERQKAAAEATLAGTGAPSVVFLHPNLAEVYRQKVARLEEALNEPAVRGEAAEILRSLIDRIVLRPLPEGDGMAAELVGDLAAILAMCDEAQNGKRPGSGEPGRQLSVVAGTRNHL